MPEPSWLGNAQAGLIDAAILGLPAVWWKYRSRWIGTLAPALWVLAVGVLGYHTIKGNLGTLVPPFVLSQVPGWALIIAFAAGALAGVGLVRLGSRPPQERPPAPSAQELPPARPAEDLAPAPSLAPPSAIEDGIDQPEALWKKLNANERDVLRELWGRTTQKLFLYECRRWIDGWGVPEWNALAHNLTELRLIGEGVGRPPGSSSLFPRAKTIYLTTKGEALMTWYSRKSEKGE